MIRWLMLSARVLLAVVPADASQASAGDVDTAFGVNGSVRIELSGEVRQSTLVRRTNGRFVYIGTVVKPTGYSGFEICVSGLLAGFNANGSPDASFGNAGIVAAANLVAKPTDALAGRCLRAAVTQRDDKVVVFGTEQSLAGTLTTFAIRLSDSGNADPTFGTSGYTVVETGTAWPSAAAVQNDGKTVVTLIGADPGFNVVRLNSDGSRDTSFGSNGKVVLPIAGFPGAPGMPSALALQRDGKIVLAGLRMDVVSQALVQSIELARLLPDGSLDTSFGVGGIAGGELKGYPVGFGALTLQSDGKIVVGAALGVNEAFALARYLPNGSLDGSFGNAGLVTTSFPGYTSAHLFEIEITPSGKLLAGGLVVKPSAGTQGAVTRYTSDGSLDPTFGIVGDGRVVVPGSAGFQSMLLGSDGSLVLTNPYSGPILLHKLKGDDALDVIEFYNTSLDHYFMSAEVQEVNDLDFGFHGGWMRTGLGFKAYFRNLGDAAVTRIYIPPALGDSHFFTSDDVELNQILAKMLTDPNYQGYVVESSDVFRVVRPDPLTGACPATAVPVYRLWNKRADSNHRYTTSLAIRLQMITRGYLPEGVGSPAVVMCAPAAQ
jgi:uncharacterized delta-60 repeat protein